MKKTITLWIALVLFLAAGRTHAQDGTLDPSFNVGSGIASTSINQAVRAIAVQPDGKILVGGDITNYNGFSYWTNGSPIFGIVRLNPDGAIDFPFSVATGFGTMGQAVKSIALQPDGKILLAGAFQSFNGNNDYHYLVRLNPEGTIDTTFNTGTTGFDASTNTVVIQPDGKILVGGRFTSYNGQLQRRITRLNPDGTLDASFNPEGAGIMGLQTGEIPEVHAMALQPDGKILVVGRFTQYNMQSSVSMARLNPDGTFDTSFNIGSGFYLDDFTPAIKLECVAVQPDGKILAGGMFNLFNHLEHPSFLRLNPDGTLDTSFNFSPSPGASGTAIPKAIVTQQDGKILVTGMAGAGYPSGLIRLNPDGTLDTSYYTGSALFYNPAILAIALQPDGKILSGGDFSYSYNSTTRNKLVRLNGTLPSLTIHTSADPGEGATTTGDGTYGYGTTATVTATADACHTFVNWTEDGTVVSTDSEYSFTVEASMDLVANFTLNTYQVSVSPSPTAGGILSGGGVYDCGDMATVTATADACYTFSNWTKNGTIVSTDSEYSFTVDTETDLVANYTLNTYEITLSANPPEGGTLYGGDTYNCATAAAIAAYENTGYTFANWTENGAVVSTLPYYSFTVAAGRDLVANFEDKDNPLSVTGQEAENMVIYPNPVKDLLYFSKQVRHITLTDLTGKVLVVQNNSSRIDMSAFAAGIYFITIEHEHGIKETSKIIKQ